MHGGGWRSGGREASHRLLEAFNERGILCAATDYRLSGVDAFQQLADIRESYDRFVTHLKENGLPLRIAVFGESAGAHLASLLLCAAPGECGEECRLRNRWVKPVKGILQSTPARFTPWEDIFPPIWASMQDIAGVPYHDHPETYRRLSLEEHIGKDNPPLFFAEAGNEHMFPPEMNLALQKRHRALGIPSRWKVYRNAEHGFFYSIERRQQRELFQDILDFLEE